MAEAPLSVVTGAFSYTGKYITRRLLARGERVRTVTGHPNRPDPFGGRVAAFPYNFERPADLAKTLEGAATLYNTYWIRFSRGGVTHQKAVENTRVLLRAAREAGVRRIVHFSITGADPASSLTYFRGKGLLENAIRESGLSYALLRPTVVFGAEDILINNIAWILRRFPVFALPGDGQYRLQPVYVDDLAGLAATAGQQTVNLETDAVGPETYTFEDLVRLIAQTVGRNVRIIHVPPRLALTATDLIGRFVSDVVLTHAEIEGLSTNLLVSHRPPTCPTRLSDWLRDHAATVGTGYASEIARHYQ